ncbi:MAG: hypothetical protein KA251_08095 [Saprospiraceae bacterium]|nr:hypothetical protein [Candidatus Vicinibacter affinis]MBP6172958.1 hypothetical protein [Saprospiraceae bacterium]MBK6571682.1 hypothetical protein [Candidatus Vicinibacter affinis]MBK6821477.1 hypothetical protein [Candidatus Vicinibacter affinis]MBK7798458.1 hypothetical protein [Candidatus Vicinibacter affinis]
MRTVSPTSWGPECGIRTRPQRVGDDRAAFYPTSTDEKICSEKRRGTPLEEIIALRKGEIKTQKGVKILLTNRNPNKNLID